VPLDHKAQLEQVHKALKAYKEVKVSPEQVHKVPQEQVHRVPLVLRVLLAVLRAQLVPKAHKVSKV
jgi:hypothetical protein